MKIEKTGSDGWCVRQVDLIINGKVIYTKNFGSGLWLDNEGSHSRIYFVDGSFLRAGTEWVTYSSPSKPYVIPRLDMRLRTESVVGDFDALNNFHIGQRDVAVP